MIELIVILLILAILGISGKKRSSRLVTFPDRERKEDLIDKVVIKGGCVSLPTSGTTTVTEEMAEALEQSIK